MPSPHLPFLVLRRRLAQIIYPPTRILEDRNADLYAELQAHLKGNVVTDDQWKDIERTKVEHTAMSKAQNEIAVFLRENWPDEILTGKHAGKSFSELVIYFIRHGNSGAKTS